MFKVDRFYALSPPPPPTCSPVRYSRTATCNEIHYNYSPSVALPFQKLCAIAPFSSRNASTDLRAVLAEKIPKEQERVKQFRKECGNVKVGEVTVDMVSSLLLPLIALIQFNRRRRTPLHIIIIIELSICI